MDFVGGKENSEDIASMNVQIIQYNGNGQHVIRSSSQPRLQVIRVGAGVRSRVFGARVGLDKILLSL